MTLGFAALLLATVLSIETTRRLRLFPAFADLSAHARRAGRLLTRTGVSEWAKERALRYASLRMFALSFVAAGRLAMVAAPFALIIGLDHWHPYGLAQAWMNWPARLWALALSSAYIVVRRTHGRGDRILQGAALGARPLVDMSFDIERAVYGRRAAALEAQAPVFICGLARSGTSILVRELHREGSFASLSYRDLPFPLAPNLWQRVSAGRTRSIDAVERGHGDGLLHDLDSPEAIEEAFWLCHEGARFRLSDRLQPIAPDPRTLAAFGEYVRLVLLRYGATRYLSKNNANVMRVSSLVGHFPDAVLIHPFRDPLQQAESLRLQHQRACQLAADDPFRARFMRWLGHHEFGADHRPIMFSDAMPETEDPSRIGYWLRLWVNTYRHLIAQPGPTRARQLFVSYDRLCRDPDATSRRIAGRLCLDRLPSFDQIRPAPGRSAAECDPALVDIARALHDELSRREMTDAW